MTHAGTGRACRRCTRRLTLIGAWLAVWGLACLVPLLAQSASGHPLIRWCRRAHQLTGSAGTTGAWLSLALFLSGSAVAAWAFVQGVRKSQRLMRSLRALRARPTPAVMAAARAAGVVHRLWYVTYDRPLALTLGLFNPVVVLSDSVAATLGQGELTAVLLHECAHVRRRDPLAHLVWASLSKGFGLLPGLNAAVEKAGTCAELQADAFALRKLGGTGDLGRALLKMARSAGPAPATAAAGFTDELELRVRSLVGEDVSAALRPAACRQGPWLMHLTHAFVLVSLLCPACLPK